MNHAQWRLLYPGANYTFGTADLPVFNRKTPEIGTPDVRTSDKDRPRSDGRAFGVDHMGGQTISFDLGVRSTSDAEVREEAATLRRVWRADAVRLAPGAVAELHTTYAGRERVVYGRPRRFSPDYSDASINNTVSVLADFACVDDLFYGPEDESLSFPIVPPTGGGLIAPLAAPLTSTASSDRSQGITVATEMPVWPVVELTGPVVNPVVSIGPVRFEFRGSLAEDETLTIDTRPWKRSALRNGASVAGSLRGTRLSQAALPAGGYEVGFGGTDPTGTALLRVTWRPTFSAL